VKPDAQELVNDPIDASGAIEGIALAKQALELEPDHPIALLVMAAIANSHEEAKMHLDKAQAGAERRLGQGFEKKYGDRFWVNEETRPYMHVLLAVAENAEARGCRKEAIAIYERMLKLNPNDNQGVRDVLLGLYLAERMLPKTLKLLTAYEDDDSAWFAWGRVLYYFVAKDRPKATRLLKKARKLNPFMEEYLSGARQFPDAPPPCYSPGDESEAILAAADLLEAWSRRQNALLWLSGELSGDPSFTRFIARIIDSRPS
jgi:tetratricopeptide (TPR) repeat protein